jgi:hypothetical protein
LIATTLLSALQPTIMADDPAARNIAATSDEFRELAKSAGKILNEATQKDMRSASRTPGFIPIDIDQHKETLQDVKKHFELKVRNYWLRGRVDNENDVAYRLIQEFERLHPGGNIRWHKSIHVITQSALIDESLFGDAEEDILLLPLFVGKTENQDKIGQPSSLKTTFRIFEGDILLFYKSVASP